MNRFFALGALFACASALHAQSFFLRPGTGATLSGDTFVVGSGSAFEIELWAEASVAAPATGSYCVVTLAHDRYDGWPLNPPNTVNVYGTPVDQKITAAPLQNSAPTIASESPFTFLGGGVGRPNRIGRNPEAGANIGVNQLGAGMGPLGWYGGWFTPGLAVVTITSPTRLLTYRFTNSIAFGDVYGDVATETGLQVYSTGETAQAVRGGSSGIAGTGIGGNFGSSKYRVAAVPEPTSLAALGLGTVLLRRRSRKKG